MIVRELKTAEWSAGDLILSSVYLGEGYSPATSATVLTVASKAASGTWLGGFKNGNLVGVVLLTCHGTEAAVVARPGGAEVRLLAVDPSHRGAGTGEALMKAAEGQARNANAEWMTFSTQTSMAAAHRLYKRLGYHLKPDRAYTSRGKDFIVYEKPLEV